MKRRSFLATLLATPVALFALARAKTPSPAPPNPPTPVEPPTGLRYSRATTCYQRLYTKLEHRMDHQLDSHRSVWINGTSANGERDMFLQHQRRTERGWEPTTTMRYSHRDDINNRIISYPKVRVDLTLDIIPVMQATAPWFKGVVAIARWTEVEGRA